MPPVYGLSAPPPSASPDFAGIKNFCIELSKVKTIVHAANLHPATAPMEKSIG